MENGRVEVINDVLMWSEYAREGDVCILAVEVV
jgi:hypothetical protein